MLCKRSEGLSFQIGNKKEKQKDAKYCFIADFTKSVVSSVVHYTEVSSVTDGTFKRTYNSYLRYIKHNAFVTGCTYQKFSLHAHFTIYLYVYTTSNLLFLVDFFPLSLNILCGYLTSIQENFRMSLKK